MGRLSTRARDDNHTAVKTTMERLLRGEIPPGGRCDIKTLATQAGVPRTGFYAKNGRPGPYQQLAQEFQRRLAALRQAGHIPDPRDAQITRLQQETTRLTQRIADQNATVADLTTARISALARIAAQHDEIQRLRSTAERAANVRTLPAPPQPASHPARPC